MNAFIIAISVLVLFRASCTPAARLEAAHGPSKIVSPRPPEEDLAVSLTMTSDYIPGSATSASFDMFVSAEELSGNGVEFSHTSLSELTSLAGPFAYISRKFEQGKTIYTMDVFTNYHVAEYEATQADILNLFVYRGEAVQARRNMALWCQTRSPQTREEAEDGTGDVICFGFMDVE